MNHFNFKCKIIKIISNTHLWHSGGHNLCFTFISHIINFIPSFHFLLLIILGTWCNLSLRSFFQFQFHIHLFEFYIVQYILNCPLFSVRMLFGMFCSFYSPSNHFIFCSNYSFISLAFLTSSYNSSLSVLYCFISFSKIQSFCGFFTWWYIVLA